MASKHVAESWGAAAPAGDRASGKRRLHPSAAGAGPIREQYPDTGRQENRPSPPPGSGFTAEHEAFEQAIRILQAQLCGRSAVDAVLNQCITEIRKLQGGTADRRSEQ